MTRNPAAGPGPDLGDEERSGLHSAIDSIDEGLQVIGFDWRYVYVNAAVTRHGRRSRQELVGRTMMKCYPGIEETEMFRALVRCMKGRRPEVMENEFVYPDGRKAWFDLRIQPYPKGIAVLSLDITERKRAENDLRRSNEELERFAYVASHDLQEPLRMVHGFVELLAKRYKGQLDADADEFIGYALEGALRMQRFIDDLLEFSRVGTRGAAVAPTNANEVLARAQASLKLSIDGTGATLTTDALPTVSVDAGQLEQLFLNLISNALKFHGPEPPAVHVSAASGNDHWVFSVRDNGIGIDPQHFDRLFQMFQRLHGREEYPGTGIGLAICRKIVERHGGKIWVESTPGHGATFRFTLPAAERTP